MAQLSPDKGLAHRLLHILLANVPYETEYASPYSDAFRTRTFESIVLDGYSVTPKCSAFYTQWSTIQKILSARLIPQQFGQNF